MNNNEFDIILDKWEKQLISKAYNSKNEYIVNYVQELSNDAKSIYNAMNTGGPEQFLWNKKEHDTYSANLTTQAGNLLTLAKSYGTKGSIYFEDPKILQTIKNSLEAFINYNDYIGKKYLGNWWDYQIGVPQKMIAILIILRKHFSINEIAKYIDIIKCYVPYTYQQLYNYNINEHKIVKDSFIPNFLTTGANKTDFSYTLLAIALFTKDANLINTVKSSINDVFKIVNSGDGFYNDGSFIQHRCIPYTGAYGNELINGVGKILSIINNSNWTLDNDDINHYANTIEKAFFPLIINGEMMPCVNGRSISRPPATTKIGFGSNTMYNLLLLSYAMNSNIKTKWQEIIKYQMLKNPEYYYNNAREYNDLKMTITLLSNNNIKGSNNILHHTKAYASMDRFVQTTNDYNLGISLHSSRIGAYEAGLENQKGWHTGDGMMYLYNDDGVQFGNSYWPTVDYYRLPGTTVDTISLKNTKGSFPAPRSIEKWVGGVANQNQAVIGMILNKNNSKVNDIQINMNLIAHKSWFIFDNQIIALGSNINATTKASIETVVDNRLLNNNYCYKIIKNKDNDNTNWLLLACNHKNSSIGYYFLDNMNINVKKETRSGKYSDINSMFYDDTLYTNEYMQITINHGQKVVDDTYAYVIIPNANQKDLEKYYTKNKVEILENSKNIHAVKFASKNYLAINFFKAGNIANIKCDNQASVMKQEINNKIIYTVSDPTQSNQVINLKIINDFSKIHSISNNVSFDINTNTIRFDFTNKAGDDLKIAFEK